MLGRFRREVHASLDARADALFESADALLCAAGPALSPAQLSLEREHRRGHGGLHDGLNAGRVAFARVRRALDALPLPRIEGRVAPGPAPALGRLLLAGRAPVPTRSGTRY